MENQNGYYTQSGGEPDPYESPYGNPSGGAYGSAQPDWYTGASGTPPFGQNTGPYGNPPYGMYGGANGYEPVPENRFPMKLTFSILEIVSCNPVTMILGVIACIFTVTANNSYRERKWQDFKSQAKVSAVCLWVGFGCFMAGLLFLLLLIAAGFGGAGSEYVYVDGTRMEIPSDYDTYEDMGYYLSKSDRFEMLSPGNHGLYLMMNDDGEYVMWCWFENSGSSDAYISECDIIGVDVDVYCDNYERYQTSEGLGFFNSKQDFIDTYGRPDDTYKDDYEDSELLCWYLGDGNDTVWQVMEVTFIEGRLYDIDIDYRQ